MIWKKNSATQFLLQFLQGFHVVSRPDVAFHVVFDHFNQPRGRIFLLHLLSHFLGLGLDWRRVDALPDRVGQFQRRRLRLKAGTWWAMGKLVPNFETTPSIKDGGTEWFQVSMFVPLSLHHFLSRGDFWQQRMSRDFEISHTVSFLSFVPTFCGPTLVWLWRPGFFNLLATNPQFIYRSFGMDFRLSPKPLSLTSTAWAGWSPKICAIKVGRPLLALACSVPAPPWCTTTWHHDPSRSRKHHKPSPKSP